MILSRRKNLTVLPSNDLAESAIFSDEDFSHFYQWLRLNEEGITWQGQYYEDFHGFWGTLFSKDSSLPQLITRFEFIFQEVTKGPLCTWFQWLRNRLVIYCFIYKKLSISELSRQTQLAPLEIAFFIRNFYIDRFPLLIDKIDGCLDPGNISSPSLVIDINFLEKVLQVPRDTPGNKQQDAISSLEVTLYPEWRKLFKKMKTNLEKPLLDIKRVQKKNSLHTFFKFLTEVSVLLCVATFFIFTLRWANEFYGDYILEKIKVSEPKFSWLNQDLSLKNEKKRKVEKTEIINRLSQLQKTFSQQKKDEFLQEERFETESDVIISSLDGTTIESLEDENSQETRLGSRRYRLGYNQVHRVIIQSTHPEKLKKKFGRMLKQYGIDHEKKIEPGVAVPGGFYYNLQVPKEHLKDFLDRTLKEENATLYETKIRGRRLPNKSRVFIFIKSV